MSNNIPSYLADLPVWRPNDITTPEPSHDNPYDRGERKNFGRTCTVCGKAEGDGKNGTVLFYNTINARACAKCSSLRCKAYDAKKRTEPAIRSCRNCGGTEPEVEFYEETGSGKRVWCKTCCRENNVKTNANRKNWNDGPAVMPTEQFMPRGKTT